ncbi:MAG: FecR domain-containing protein [Gammaproteobacteria bacterium]
MNEVPESPKPHTRCLVEAAAWRANLTEAGLESAPEFELWLAADESHREAWKQLTEPWDLLGEHAMTPEVLKLRSDALKFLHVASRTRSQSSLRGFFRGAQRRRAALSIAAGILVAAVGSLFWALNAPTVYRTGPGDRRVATLMDGSQVELDSSSEVRVRYTKRGRELSLRRGQAKFTVVHDDRRPFSVVAGARKVIATGTSFDIDMLGSALYVTLLEGHVRVLPQGATPHTLAQTELDAGQQLVVSPRGEARVVPASIEHVLAWQSGQIIFDDEPLATAIERVNRYSATPLVLADPQVGALRISGVFHTNNVRGFVDTLTSYLPVQAEKRRGVTVLRAQPGG